MVKDWSLGLRRSQSQRRFRRPMMVVTCTASDFFPSRLSLFVSAALFPTRHQLRLTRPAGSVLVVINDARLSWSSVCGKRPYEGLPRWPQYRLVSVQRSFRRTSTLILIFTTMLAHCVVLGSACICNHLSGLNAAPSP